MVNIMQNKIFFAEFLIYQSLNIFLLVLPESVFDEILVSLTDTLLDIAPTVPEGIDLVLVLLKVICQSL